jgi:acetyl-CoA decarbonylase/synthase complex subunit delta
MTVEIPKTAYSGKIREMKLGSGYKAVTIGGETAYPFYLFEGKMKYLPKIAMEVFDSPPEEWPEAALEPFVGVTNDPVAWAKKCVDDYGAEMICLKLVPRLISSVRDFGNLTLETEDALRQPWLKVLCS